MVSVEPFRGILYNREKIHDLSLVTSPPYDIISPKMQEELYRKSEYNIVRLILGKILPGDDERNNRYTRARDLFNKWLEEGILIEDREPSIYPYKVEYRVNGKEKVMRGFFILLKLDHEYRQVKAHERTLSKPKEDRLKLMRETKANLEPIELLYMDEEDRIMEEVEKHLDRPCIDVVGYDTFRHRLWRVQDDELIRFIKDELRDEVLYIADGHHRYQTSVDYAREVGAGENDPRNYMMVVLANMFDEGLTILPTHRLVRTEQKLGEILEGCRDHFHVEEIDMDREGSPDRISREIQDIIRTDDEHRFALYHREGVYVLTLKDEKVMDRLVPERSKAWRTLDVSILHKLVIEGVLGITDETLEERVKYTRDTATAIKKVEGGEFDLSFILNPTKIEQIKEIASMGEHMPQKSTYFLPKLLSGLVMRRF